ncbi:hypothetical protein IQ07DRAFT_292415 [Pyrenochaeta sp. DS3sAY3a]|nr:hypothetical protein IQ07DRAFT_292415 [Pyrenochaeta sp. DS3sAY3a]
MEEALKKHVKTWDNTDQTEVPQLHLSLKRDSDILSLTLPYTIQFDIYLESSPGNKPVIIKWNPYIQGFASGDFLLLRHIDKENHIVLIDCPSALKVNENALPIRAGHNDGLWDLSPGKSATLRVTIHERYQKLLEPHKSYTVLWRGGPITTWDYGTIAEHAGQVLQPNEHSLWLPGGPLFSFTTRFESRPWPMRHEREAAVGFKRANLEEQQWRSLNIPPFPPVDKRDRNPNAPKLTVSLSGARDFHKGGRLPVTTTVTYEAEPTARPITFHTFDILDLYSYELGRLRNGKWESVENYNSGCTGWRIVDDPDVTVNVSTHKSFISLAPGGTWTTEDNMEDDWGWLPDDVEDGETFGFVHIGGEVDWWDYGSAEDHADTTVDLPCFVWGPVLRPAHNDGRPKLYVPVSKVLEFKVLGKK